MLTAESDALQKAVSALRASDNEMAMETLKQLLADIPGHELASGMLASIYAEIGMVDEAIGLYQGVIAQHPDNHLARVQWGQLLFNRGQSIEALDVWEPVRAASDDYMAHFLSALAMIKLGRLDEARDLLAIASLRMPQTHGSRPHLEECQRALQQ